MEDKIPHELMNRSDSVDMQNVKIERTNHIQLCLAETVGFTRYLSYEIWVGFYRVKDPYQNKNKHPERGKE